MNIRTLVLAATFMPAIALAQVATTAQDTTYTQKSGTVPNMYDTTFVFNSQKFAISQNGERTNVSVYKKCGTEMKKVSLYLLALPFLPIRTKYTILAQVGLHG